MPCRSGPECHLLACCHVPGRPERQEGTVTAARSRRLPERNPATVSRKFDDDYVVLSTTTNQAHALDGDVALLWAAAGDRTWPDLPDERIDEIVGELIESGLL